MNRNMIALCTAFLMLTVSACGTSPAANESAAVTPKTPPAVTQSAGVTDSQDTPSPASISAAPLQQADFVGKVHAFAYAGGDKVMVLSDELYLYDTLSGQILATASVPLSDFVVQTFTGGYLVVGNGDSGVVGYLYDDTLSNVRELVFQELVTDDFIISEACIAISDDGETLAMAGLSGLYLYDLTADTLSTLLTYGEHALENGVALGMVNSIAFPSTAELAFIGLGNSVPVQEGEDGFSVYGTIGMDGALHITKSADYTVSELLTGGTTLLLPQDFSKNDGTLLSVECTTGQTRTYHFSTKSEGNDGVFCSSGGRYFATAVVGDDLTVRIYDAQSGEVCHTEVITNADSAYFLRIPQILMLDQSKTCIVLMGRGISEVDTLITAFPFERNP